MQKLEKNPKSFHMWKLSGRLRDSAAYYCAVRQLHGAEAGLSRNRARAVRSSGEADTGGKRGEVCKHWAWNRNIYHTHTHRVFSFFALIQSLTISENDGECHEIKKDHSTSTLSWTTQVAAALSPILKGKCNQTIQYHWNKANEHMNSAMIMVWRSSYSIGKRVLSSSGIVTGQD